MATDQNPRRSRKPGATARKSSTGPKTIAGETLLAGFSQRTRQAVQKAAKMDGVGVRAWADKTLREAAESALKGGSSPPSLTSEFAETLDDISKSMKELADRRFLSDLSLKHMQEAASDWGEHISSTYGDVAKRSDAALDEIRSRTGTALSEAAKWGSDVVEQLKKSATELGQRQQAERASHSTEYAGPMRETAAGAKPARKSPPTHANKKRSDAKATSAPARRRRGTIPRPGT